MLAVVLGHSGSHGFQLGILELIGVIGGYTAARGDVGELIFDHTQILAGQAANASVGHERSLLILMIGSVHRMRRMRREYAKKQRDKMNNWNGYRLLLGLLPKKGKVNFSDFSREDAKKLERLLRRHRCVGASLCVFDETGVKNSLSFGLARRGGEKAQMDTVYRAASVSKPISAMGVMKLREHGKVDLDADVQAYFPISLRHPKAPDTPITLRMLLSHTAGIHDGECYNSGIGKGISLSEVMKGDSFCDHLPHEKWEYSNLGAGIGGAVTEAAAGQDFEALMQETVFAPLSGTATYYPQKVRGMLADAYRILPPQKAPNFDAKKRQSRPMPEEKVDGETHYALAHGNLYISAPELAKLGVALMQPGFLTEESLEEMRKIIAPFGERASNLSQGIGTFILQEKEIASRPIFGHQGMAYGAVHGLFFDPVKRIGMALLTSGANEARKGVLADLNFDLLKLLMGGD